MLISGDMNKKIYDKHDLEKIVLESNSIAEVLRSLNLVPRGGNYKIINRQIKEHEIDTTHFTGKLWNKGTKWINSKARIPLPEIMVANSSFNTTSLKSRLFSEGIKEKICESCRLTMWMDEPIALELHHINGIHYDHRKENLMILCPNCHALTDNYRGKNQPVKIKPEKEQAVKRINKNKGICLKCSKEIYKSKSGLCSICVKETQRKVERPSREQLLEDLSGSNFTKVGIKYGVSDNSIKRWLK